MIKERENIFNNLLAIIDIFLTILAFISSYYIRKFLWSEELAYSDSYITIVLLIVPTWFVALKVTNLSKLLRGKAYSFLLYDYLKVIAIGMSILFLFVFSFKLDSISRIVLYLFGFIDFLFLFGSKFLIYALFKHYRKQGYNSRNLLVITDKESEEVIDEIETNKDWGYKISIIVVNSEELRGKYISKYKSVYLADDIDFHKLIEDNPIDEVIYAKKDIDMSNIREIVYSCEEIGVVFKLKSNFFNMVATKAELDYMGSYPYLKFVNTPTGYLALKVKRLADIVSSLIFIVLFSPIFLAVAVAVKLTSKGPIVFTQKRVGLRGREFNLYKFRTMVENAEELKKELEAQNEMDGPVFKIKKDPRITKIGSFLRKSSLDEFPQFFNVLRGDMSIVGPRPPLPKEVAKYERWQRRRLSMKPGITCIWQVSGRNEISFEEWMKLDLEYIDNWSLKLDFSLFIKTIKVVLLRKGAS